MENLPNPGELLIYDYRDTTAQATTESIKVLQWNVERNYSKISLLLALTRSAFIANFISESDEIIETLKRLDPDIAIIQEIDIHCKRSGNINHLENICKALSWRGGFVAEFFEVESPIRQVRDQVC
jgi:hypothetical protein